MASAVLPSRNEQCWGEAKARVGNYRNNPTNSTRFASRLNPNPDPNPSPNPNLPWNLAKNSKTNLVWQMGDLKNHIRQKNEPPKRPPATPLPAAFHVSQPSHQKPVCPVLPKDPFHREYVTFNLASYSNLELKELKKRLMLELQCVRSLLERIEARHINSRPGLVDPKFMPPPSFQESHHAPETSAGKRTPKRNQQSGNSGFFTSGKIKKKISGQKRALPFAVGSGSKRSMVPKLDVQRVENAMMTKCKQILMKLLKLKHAFVFSEPVDVQGLKLHDYYQIIKQPMDLGTVKSRLIKKEYQTPLDFASDVRLTFENALKYNPKGHEVHTAADSMLLRFEKWFQPEYENYEIEYQNAMTGNLVDKKGSLPKSVAAAEETYMKMPSLPTMTSSHPVKVVDMMQSVSGDLPKPKARDLNKRPMTSEEKLKLAIHLENILPEKMEQVVQIMRKGSPQLLLDGGDIELDIESLDTEMLWELDRFIRNHKRTCGKLNQDHLENASGKEVKSGSLNEVLKVVRIILLS